MQARRDRHERLVREPMSSLCDALAEQFGPAHVWHLHSAPHLWRSQVAEVEVADRVVLGLRLSLSGLEVWGGMQRPAPTQLAAYRDAVSDAQAGRWLARTTAGLVARGWLLTGQAVKTRPRGIPADHPRLDLVRRRELLLAKEWAVGPWLSSGEPLDRVRVAWGELMPLLTWLAVRTGPDPPTRRSG
jgi:hypothetical protein